MSAETKERLRLARLAAKIRASKTTEELSEPFVTHETDDDWIEITVRIKRPRYRAPSGALPSEAH